MRVRHPALDAYTNVATAPKKSEGTPGHAPERARHRASTGESASVEFSGEARQLAAARASTLRDDGVDLEKVAALRAKIERGDFKVDSKRIAQGLLDEMA